MSQVGLCLLSPLEHKCHEMRMIGRLTQLNSGSDLVESSNPNNLFCSRLL